jgi:RpiR family carbohydrate utilization transcriptional regulator
MKNDTTLKTETSIPIMHTIRRKQKDMTPIQLNIAYYVLSQPAKVVKMSISNLAMETGAKSESSVVRFYRTLGFASYHDFKVTLATEIAGKSFYHTYEDITINDDLKTIKQKIFQGAMKTLDENISALDDATLMKAVEIIENAKRLFFIGYASSGAVAYDAFLKFSGMGFYCQFSTDSYINAMLLSYPNEVDVVICISHSGESKDIVIPIQAAKPLAKIIAITGFPDSHLGKIADVCISTISEEMNYRTDVMVS